MDEQFDPIIPEPVQELSPPKSRARIGFVVLSILIAISVGWYVFMKVRHGSPTEVGISTPSPTLNLENTLEYKFYDPNLPFSIRYPNNYCPTQDIGAVVIHDESSPCGGNNAINTKDNFLIIFGFPEIGVNTTQEYIKSDRFKDLIPTGTTRMIGGYEATQLENPITHESMWVFLTDYKFQFSEKMKQQMSGESLGDVKYGVAIQSKLSNDLAGKTVEELILSTFNFK